VTGQVPLTAPPGLRRLKLTYNALRKWWYTSLWSVMGRMWVAETCRLLLKDLMVPRIQTYLSCLRCVSESAWRRRGPARKEGGGGEWMWMAGAGAERSSEGDKGAIMAVCYRDW
jgi:hypothetical protein